MRLIPKKEKSKKKQGLREKTPPRKKRSPRRKVRKKTTNIEIEIEDAP